MRRPTDPEKRKEFDEKQRDKLDAQLERYNQKNGGETEIFKEAKK